MVSDLPPETGLGAGPDSAQPPDGSVDLFSAADVERRLDPHRGADVDRRLDASGKRPDVDLYKHRGLDLTPEEIVARRHNRRWMVSLTLIVLIIAGAAAVASVIAESNEPSGPKQSAPAGYQVENDSYFSYLVPKSWSNNPSYTDDAGDVETSGPSGWVGEHIAYRLKAPTLDEARPGVLESFGMPRPEPYKLGDGHLITVPGAATSFEYDVTRSGGFHAVAVDSWDARAGVELWLIVDAPSSEVSELLSSLKA